MHSDRTGLSENISIHTPLRGATSEVPNQSEDTKYFNPHSP